MGKNIIKLNEISKAYSDLIAERLADGYVLNTRTMSGSQGEYGRFDLTKDGGKTVHRLYMSREFDKSSIKSENKDWKRDIFISAANFKYPTVKTKELKKIPIQDICADDCL